MGLMTHLVQAKDSVDIHTTAVNIRIRKKSNYSRMFLFREIYSRTGQVVYIIEGKSSNERLWGRNYQVCYNGVLTIGTYITILNHFPILNRLVNEITILESRHSAVIM